MRYQIIAAGRAGRGPEQALAERYAARLHPPIVFREVEDRRPGPATQHREREGEKLLAAVAEGARIVALDERGRGLTSVEFARVLGGWRDAGTAEVAFLIGGADGLSEAVRKRADLVLALGTLTWPHLLVRTLIAEQIYRAQSILDGHPYHRA